MIRHSGPGVAVIRNPVLLIRELLDSGFYALWVFAGMTSRWNESDATSINLLKAIAAENFVLEIYLKVCLGKGTTYTLNS